MSVDSGPWLPAEEIGRQNVLNPPDSLPMPKPAEGGAWSSLDDIRKRRGGDAWGCPERTSPRQSSVDLPPSWASQDGKRRGSFTPASDDPSPLPLGQMRPGKGNVIPH